MQHSFDCPASYGSPHDSVLCAAHDRKAATAVAIAPAPVRDETTMRIYSRLTQRWFTVRLLLVGDKYGFERCLTWGQGKYSLPKPGVEFYDATYASDPRFVPGLGQFVSNYYVDTLLEYNATGGLDLQGNVENWKLDAAAMDVVRAWLWNVTPDVA